MNNSVKTTLFIILMVLSVGLGIWSSAANTPDGLELSKIFNHQEFTIKVLFGPLAFIVGVIIFCTRSVD
ncbi:hypothetical protein [Rosenbergiella collisarenosi]|uniref:hypothetical protein n=1 Tax=Rosenbergiella collisarenosi TaxID=1544695 RepID=UPI001F4EC123|nr:hypothetical protein [Rosenbergiella collisarenosi]